MSPGHHKLAENGGAFTNCVWIVGDSEVDLKLRGERSNFRMARHPYTIHGSVG